jgi:hypothetical protein
MEVRERPMMLSDRLYNIIRRSATILLPGLITFYLTVGQVWNFPKMEQVGATLGALNVFLGVVVVFARAMYNVSGTKYGGELEVVDGEDGSSLHLRSVDAGILTDKDEITFKIKRS